MFCRIAVCLFALISASHAVAAEWKPVAGPLSTRWAKDVSADKPLPEYPRPQLARRDWKNLNGLWNYAVLPKADGEPNKFDGESLGAVPHSVFTFRRNETDR